MENESIKKTIEFINELETLETLDNRQIMDYAQWAGRLSSLGINKYLNRFFERFDAASINSALKKRIIEGLNDIKEAFGEYLAVEIFTVQDFCCFVNHAPEDAINSDVKELLEFWVQTAELQSLDSEAAQTLENYLDSYPIDEEDQLDVIAAPLTGNALSFWTDVLEPIDDLIDQNSKKLSSQIHIEKTGDASNENLISVHISGVDPDDIAKVRQLGIPALRSKTDPSVWTFDFSAFGTTFNKQGDIVVHTYDGAQASVPVASVQPFAYRVTNTEFNGTKLFEPCASLNAAVNQVEYKECVAEGTNVALDIEINHSLGQVVVNVWQDWSCNNRSNELDGWSFYDRSNTLLGVIQNSQAKFKCSQFDGYVELKDVSGKTHKLCVNK